MDIWIGILMNFMLFTDGMLQDVSCWSAVWKYAIRVLCGERIMCVKYIV